MQEPEEVVRRNYHKGKHFTGAVTKLIDLSYKASPYLLPGPTKTFVKDTC